MDPKMMCVTNVKYKKLSQHEARRMKNLLAYLTYRDSRDDYVPQDSGMERWVDRGMGKSATQIANRCDDYQSKHVLLFSLVVNPNPDLIHMVPNEDSATFVRKLSERTVEGFFDARGIDTGVEYSYVTHPCCATRYLQRCRRRHHYFSKNKQVNDIEMIHGITQEHMIGLMDQYAGRDWEQRYDELATIRTRQQQIVLDEQPRGAWSGDPVWAGVRRTDGDTSAAGVYGYFANHERKTTLQFRPVVTSVDHEEAEQLAGP